MKSYFLFALKRFIQLLAVVFAGCSVAFVISHLSPISPVESIIGRVSGQSTYSPEAVASLRATLTELFGLNVPMHEQYFNFLRRLVVGDFGPSLLAFPRPAMQLVMLALPWTVGLLVVSTVLTWLLGNIAGGLAGYYQNSRILRALGVVAIGLQPIPYYIVAFLMVIIFGFVWPVLPISGGFAMNVRPGWTPEFILSVLHYSILPAASLTIVGIGTWFLGHARFGLQYRHRGLCDLCRTGRGQAQPHRFLLCHPQRHGAAIDLAGDDAGRHLFGHYHHRAGVRLSGPRQPAGGRRQ